MIAILSMNLATSGRCSEILMPGTAVGISLKGPPLAWPTFRSHRSMVLGPPFIHRRMTDFLRFGSGAGSSARALNQPEVEAPTTLADARRSQSRREIAGRMGVPL